MGTEPFNPDDPIAVLRAALPPDQRPLLTTEHVMEALGCTRRQVERWSQSGRLACTHLGNERRYTPAALAAYVRENTASALR